jgi:hypothetical protein
MLLTKLETLLSMNRLASLIKYSNMVYEMEGDVAEFGVFRGGSLELLAQHNEHKTVFGIDSFEGLPKPTANKDTYHKEGDFKEVDFDDVKGYFKIMYRNVELLKGFSPSVFENIDKYKKFSLVHIDVDLYQSVKDALDYFYPRLVDGGVIICDDIGWESVAGGEQALLEFAATINPTFKGELFYYPGKSNKQYLIVK